MEKIKVSGPATKIRYLKEREAEEITGLSVSKLQKLRYNGGGPPFIKVDRCVRYAEHELISWLQSMTRYSEASTKSGAA